MLGTVHCVDYLWEQLMNLPCFDFMIFIGPVFVSGQGKLYVEVPYQQLLVTICSILKWVYYMSDIFK